MCRSSYIFLILIHLLVACGTTRDVAEKEPSISENPESAVIEKIALDPLGQLYSVTSDNEIIQYRADGTVGFRYNNNKLGRLGEIDPGNPFNILLYYPDFQTIILLDRTLNEQTRIVLSELDLIDIELVALGADNLIWLYDAVDIQLKKLDQAGKISFRSDRLNQLLQDIPQPDQLLAFNTRLFLNDPGRGILAFDQFGRYETTLPVIGADNLQLIKEDRLLYTRKGKVYSYDLRAFRESLVDLNITCRENCQLLVGKEKIFWLENGQLQSRVLRISP